MKQEDNLFVSATQMISSLLTQTSNNPNNAYLYGHHQMEYKEIKLTILLIQSGGRAQL